MRQALTLIFVLTFLHGTFAQDELAIGEWQSLLPYTTFVGATQSDDFFFFSTDASLLAIDKEENTNRFLSRVDGLSETGVTAIKADPETGILVVGYDNSVFDLVSENGIIGFTDISRDGNFNDRSINNIIFDEGQFIYFATGFGVTKFDLERQEFVYTVATGMPVTDVAIFDGNIYISTEDGIFFIDKSDNANQQAFGDWELIASNFNFPSNYLNLFLESKGDYLFMDIDNGIARFDGTELEILRPGEVGFSVNFLSAENQRVVAGYRCDDNCRGNFVTWDPATETLTELDNSCLDRPTFAIEDEQGNIWSTDAFTLIRRTDGQGNGCDKLSFNSPFSGFVSEITVVDNSVYIAGGGLLTNLQNAQRRDGTFIRDPEGNWSVFSERTFPILSDAQEDAALDHYRVIGHPSNGNIYYGTYYGGLIETNAEGEIVTIYNDSNSSLQGANGDEQRERVAGLAFDNQENLWITNNSAPRPISVLTNEGETFNFSAPFTNLGQLAIDRIGYKWAIINGSGQGILVFDDNGTIEDTSDDRTRVITTNNSNLPDNEVLSIEADKQGDIWVGTIDGVVVFECGSTALEGICIGNKRVVTENEVDDESENLLKGEVVSAIGIDGADRKWFGTSSGVFVQDDNGTENIAFFNEDNSPLLDNNIIDIAFNDETGDVFIGTEKGVIQLRGEAVEGGPVNSSNAYAFPNPVRPDYDGPIAIKGLANNANVKITDISGTLIFETTALGGQAIWDGRDYNGRKASTGVYLVFSTADNVRTPDAITTKILFIK